MRVPKVECYKSTCRLRTKVFERHSFINHDCSGTRSHAASEGHRSENATGGKVGFKLVTDSIQLYVFA